VKELGDMAKKAFYSSTRATKDYRKRRKRLFASLGEINKSKREKENSIFFERSKRK